MPVLLVALLRHSVPVKYAESGHATKVTRPQVPHAARPEKRVIVESRRQNTRKPLDPGVAVALQRSAVVLTGRGQALPYRGTIRQAIRTSAERDQRIAVLARHGDDSAGAMVLERSAQQPDIVGGQGAGDGISRKARVAPAFEAERHRPGAVDQMTVGERQPILAGHGHGSPVPPVPSTSSARKTRTISSLRVSRSTRNQ